MNIVVNEKLKTYIDPLTPDEHDALERSLLAEGCRDALVLWGEVLVDGHNRYGICQKHSLPFQTLQSSLFESMDDVHLWMIDQHLGRRSVSDFQRGVLALRKREILRDRKLESTPSMTFDAESQTSASANATDAIFPATADPLKSRESIAKAAGLSSSQVILIEKIQKQATPEVVAAVKSGSISINTAAAVSSLPEREQIAAALGGKELLQQAAKRVRESKKRAPKPEGDEAQALVANNIDALKARIQQLETENAQLRQQLAAQVE